MWGDRLLDAKALEYSKWEASANRTWPATDMIPKDIVICDWHYEKQAHYKSLPYLLKKGFRVWPSGWHDMDAARMLMDDSIAQHNPRGYRVSQHHLGPGQARRPGELPADAAGDIEVCEAEMTAAMCR